MIFRYTEVDPILITDVTLVLDSDPTIGIPIVMSPEQNLEFVAELKTQEAYIKRVEAAYLNAQGQLEAMVNDPIPEWDDLPEDGVPDENGEGAGKAYFRDVARETLENIKRGEP